MKSQVAILAIGLAVAMPQAKAAEEHGPHEHGAGRLQLAVEKGDVEIELALPGVDVVGFEHAAESAENRQAAEAAMAKLRDGAALFRFPAAAGCRLEKVDVNLMTGGHDDEHGKEHAHDKKHEHERESGHTEFRAHYHFHCDAPAKAQPLDVRVFAAFPSLHEIRALTISAAGQGAMELTPDATSLKF